MLVNNSKAIYYVFRCEVKKNLKILRGVEKIQAILKSTPPRDYFLQYTKDKVDGAIPYPVHMSSFKIT